MNFVLCFYYTRVPRYEFFGIEMVLNSVNQTSWVQRSYLNVSEQEYLGHGSRSCQATAGNLGVSLSQAVSGSRFKPSSREVAAQQLVARISLQGQFVVDDVPEGTRFHYGSEKNRHFITAIVDENFTMAFSVRAKGDPTQFGSGKDMFFNLMEKIEAEGLHVDRIKADWQFDTESVNARVLHENLARGMGLTATISKTWTARCVAQYGFHPFTIVGYGHCFEVVFKRRQALGENRF
jgi:hypothetical protein